MSYRINQKGFTLVELMVVVGIIGILAAIVIASYSSYRNKSKASKLHEHSRACAQIAVAECQRLNGAVLDGAANLAIANACPNGTTLPSGESVSFPTRPTACNPITSVASATIGSTAYTCNCTGQWDQSLNCTLAP